jgi:hypothetical protein
MHGKGLWGVIVTRKVFILKANACLNRPLRAVEKFELTSEYLGGKKEQGKILNSCHQSEYERLAKCSRGIPTKERPGPADLCYFLEQKSFVGHQFRS